MAREVPDEEAALADVIERLQARFPHTPHSQIVTEVHDAHRAFEGAKVRDFVPVLIEREARARIERPL